MALTSPRKHVIPLSTGDEPRSRSMSTLASNIKRAFYCGIVVEGSENGRRLPDDIQDLVLSFGSSLSSESSQMLSSSSSSSIQNLRNQTQRARKVDPQALAARIEELVTTERSYVRKLQILKQDYADPLRNFARNKNTAIINAYQAKTLFGNIDNLLPVNEAFLADLEKMIAPNGYNLVGGVGDVALKHLKELRGFEQYRQYYAKREEAQAIFEEAVSKGTSGFASYIDHIKYQSADSNNRVGLRELLMEPVQRIPRYTLLFREIIKDMEQDDPQRVKLLEADEIASKIAQAETDEKTKRAAIFYCLNATIDGFPADLSSHSRKFIDCIDVEDVPIEGPVSSSSSASNVSSASLHCSLLLFDDKLVIAKRPGDKACRQLTGLDSLEKLTKAGGLPSGKKRSGMSFKGVVDLTDVAITDIGGADMNLFLENPPQDQTERWSGRPLRALSVVKPPLPINLDPTRTEADKQRFLNNLWEAQAMYRARAGQSVVLQAEDQEVDVRMGRTTTARTYFNVYQRKAFLQEPKKTKVVVHIDPAGADPLPFGMNGPPFVVIRVQPMEGFLCRYSVLSSEPNNDIDEDIVQTDKIPSRVIQTIQQFGLFEFRTGKNSLPSTPTNRSKVAIFGLDAISRNLFGGNRPGSAMGDFFSGSINGHKRLRSKSTTSTSRSSMYTQTTATTMDSMKFSHRSNSTATAPTSVSGTDDESYIASRSSKGNKLSRNHKQSASMSDLDSGSPALLSLTRSRSRASSTASSRDMDYSDNEDNTTILAQATDIGSSDYHLALQLELARQNSMNQHGKHLVPMEIEGPVESTIYEEEPPLPVRPSSRASKTPRPSGMHRSSISLLDSPPSPPRNARPLSIHSVDKRPMGPRSPSPLPPSTPQHRQTRSLPSMDDDLAREAKHSYSQPLSSSPYSSGSDIPRSSRQSFHASSSNIDATPKASSSHRDVVSATPIEPLSIKKKTSGRSSTASTSPSFTRKSFAKNSPLSRGYHQRVVSPRRVSPQVRNARPRASGNSTQVKSEDFEYLQQLVTATKEDIESSRRTVKRIKLESEVLRQTSHSREDSPRSASPDKALRGAPVISPVTKAAQERLEEMRNLIGKRNADGTPVKLRASIFDTPTRHSLTGNDSNDFMRTVDVLVAEADKELVRADANQDSLKVELARLASAFKERATELEATKYQLQHAKRQCELVKRLLEDANAEKEIMYDAFNEELDGMFNDAHLPPEESWEAMSSDLRNTKETRNRLTQENSCVYSPVSTDQRLSSRTKSKLFICCAKSYSKIYRWGNLLRSHGLIPP
ncbi:hypothetical protein CVT24_008360 [Panaeolus cyanescens]|uniref:DH domain-containing protein n=1 Tax=Panaeolus cyanescens TaxID=181874 RepID=A0A409VC48_9AGAR|nr:hypothetical protein CVT24_008360 [Panaeolus cyanescens]